MGINTGLSILFWLSLAVVLYTYAGYALLVWAWARLVRRGGQPVLRPFEPSVTLIIPAYNESGILEEKIRNCRSLAYPADKLTLICITDGSTDHPAEILSAYPEVIHLHQPERGGKAAALNRAMTYVRTPYVVFTDCNTLLNPEAIRELVKHYQDPTVGAVSGEKRVLSTGTSAGAGEGLYWRYESFLKRCDSDICSLMGAAGELVSFRTDLLSPLEPDTILDDFVQSLRVVEAGYRVVYEPAAYASEAPSASLREEMKRKIRICAGGWQSMFRLKSLLNPSRHPRITFLYVSHRVLRWSLTPLLLVLLIPLNAWLALTEGGFFTLLMSTQAAFYLMAGLGWQSEKHGRRAKILLIPLYFTLMNIAVLIGFRRFMRNEQSAAWEKARRAVVQ